MAAQPLDESDGPGGPGDARADDGKRVLEEVIVTAQKVEKTLEQVPASVSTIDGEFIQESGAFDFPDLANYAPNVEIRINPQGGQIRMRGFGTQSANAGFEPSVGTVVDGVFYARSQFLTAFFHDLDRVEVLRGPQGTLFGKNSTAGVLNVVTGTPELDAEPGGEFDVLYGTFGERMLRPAVQMPLGEDLAARVSASITRSEGRLHNTLLERAENDVEQTTTRARLRWAPAPALTVDVGGFHSRQDLNNGVYQFLDVSDDMLTLARDFDPQVEADAFDDQVSANVPTRLEITFTGANTNVDVDLEPLLGWQGLTLTSITAAAELVNTRRDIDADFSPIPVIRTSLIEPSVFTQFSQELRLGGNRPALFGFGHGLEYVVGGYYFQSDLLSADRFELEDLGAAAAYLQVAQANENGLNGVALPGGGALTADAINLLIPALELVGQGEQAALTTLDQSTETVALFGQAELFVTPRWAVIAGLRLGRETKRGAFETVFTGEFVQLVVDPQATENRGGFTETVERSEREVSPKLGFRWEASDALNVYGTASRGFKSGGFNAIALTDDALAFEPERATSYELGAKARLLGGSMRFSGAVFSTDFENLQVSTFRDNRFLILNAAEARSQGFEGEMTWLPPFPGSQLTATLGYADAVFTRYPEAPAIAGSGAETQDLAGRQLPYSSKWSASVIPQFTVKVPGVNIGLTTAVDLLYRSERFLDVDLDPQARQPETLEINARMTLASFINGWTLTAAGRNLTDERYLNQVLDQPLAPGNYAAVRGDRGRFYSLNARWAF